MTQFAAGAGRQSESLNKGALNNKAEKIGSLDIAISNDKSVTINRLNDVTTVTVRDRNTGKITSETSTFREIGVTITALLKTLPACIEAFIPIGHRSVLQQLGIACFGENR